jgi:hypothetical protein
LRYLIVRRTGVDRYTICAERYVGPTVANIVTAGAQPAVIKADYHRRLLPMGGKTVDKGGSGADSDELSVVVLLST